ncbi:MAG: hypothetical protein EZS28_033925, partial [Streblomastix strix]
NYTDSAPVGVQEKPKKGKGSKKSKTEGLNVSDEQSQGSNAKAQTKTTSKLPKPKSPPKRGREKVEQVKPDLKNSNDEDEGKQIPQSGRDTPTKGDQR